MCMPRPHGAGGGGTRAPRQFKFRCREGVQKEGVLDEEGDQGIAQGNDLKEATHPDSIGSPKLKIFIILTP